MSITNSGDWPDNFDFDKDAICQRIFLPFIQEHLDGMANLDQERIIEFERKKNSPEFKDKFAPDEKLNYTFSDHLARVHDRILDTADLLGIDKTAAKNTAKAALLHDYGKLYQDINLWIDTPEKSSGALKETRRQHAKTGADLIKKHITDNIDTFIADNPDLISEPEDILDHPFLSLALDIAENHHEHMDGSGTLGKTADQLSGPVKLVAIIESHDGYCVKRPHQPRARTPLDGFEHMVKKDGLFDPTYLHAFKKVLKQEEHCLKKPEQNSGFPNTGTDATVPSHDSI